MATRNGDGEAGLTPEAGRQYGILAGPYGGQQGSPGLE